MNQEQVTTENTEEKAAEVTAVVRNDGTDAGAGPARRENGSAAVFMEVRMSLFVFWTD